MPDYDPEEVPMPDYKDLDADAFEDEWRAWLENPPVDWAPPRGATRIFTSTLDMRKEGDFIMRFDAWQGDAGIHTHARVVILTVAPAYVIEAHWLAKRDPWWAFWKKKQFVMVGSEEKVVDRKIISKSVVGSFILPWRIWADMEDDKLNPDFPKKPNGKGGDPDPKIPWRSEGQTPSE